MNPLFIRSTVAVVVCCISPGSLAALSNDDLCAILTEHTPDGTEGCLANIAPEPSDNSFIFLTRNGSDVRALLLRSDLNSGGDCRPSKGKFAGSLCVTFDYESPPDFDAICPNSATKIECRPSTSTSKFAIISAGSTTAVGGVNPAPSEPYFIAARGLEAGDVSLQQVGDTLIYKGSASADGRTLRLSRADDRSPSMWVRPLVDVKDVLAQAITAINAKGIAFANVVAIGTEGRFISIDADKLVFHGTPDDCGGGSVCREREILDEGAFDARLAAWTEAVPIESISGELRQLLMEKLLLGVEPYEPLDKALDAARVRQPPALLLLKWD